MLRPVYPQGKEPLVLIIFLSLPAHSLFTTLTELPEPISESPPEETVQRNVYVDLHSVIVHL
jgi:hypothetical protein